jgi:hypothetical protein
LTLVPVDRIEAVLAAALADGDDARETEDDALEDRTPAE